MIVYDVLKDWSSLAPRRAWDGSLRDVIIRDCVPEDWGVLFGALGRRDDVTLRYPAPDSAFWNDPKTVFSRYGGESIFLSRDGINLKCDLVSPDLIEFDLDPREIEDQSTFDSLVSLMEIMAAMTDKSVALTEEGDHDHLLMQVSPGPHRSA